MRIRKGLTFVVVAWASALGGVLTPHMAMGQTAEASVPAPAPVFDGAAKSQAIAAAAKLLTDEYVFPDVGVKAAAMLTQNLAAGKYDAAATPGDFAAQVTTDLRDFTHDKHLRVDADDATPEGVPPGPPPPVGLYGFAQVDRLKGNIGYIVLNYFWHKDSAKIGADKAMGLLASTDALIIDLRNNGGGDPEAVAYLDSFFVDGKTPVHITDLLWRKAGTTDYTRQVLSTGPTPVSYLNKPVYLITSHYTFSGAEAFAYDLRNLKRATMVGEVTVGGAHPVDFQPIGSGLFLWVPYGYPDNPITHTDWEGTGVQPDIPVPADQGFATAYDAALHVLGRQAPVSVDSAEAVTEAHLLLPPRNEAAPGSEDALRRYIAGLADGNPPYDLMSADWAANTRQNLAWLQPTVAKLGALQSLTFVRVDLMGQDVYDGQFANGLDHFQIALGPDGKITSCWFQTAQ